MNESEVETDHAYLILKALSEKGMSQKMLARYTSLSTSFISKIISCQKNMSVENAKRIANALKTVTAEQLLIAQVKYQLSK